MKISGKKLKTALRVANITQQEAADILEVSRQTVNSWISKEELADDILVNVKTKLNIDLSQYGQINNKSNGKLLSPSKEYRKINEDSESIGIPMYNVPGAASNVEMYGDPNDVKIVGYLNIPGATKDSFALPVHGNSMYPTLENGSWCILRPISDVQDIQWGEIYYIEYGDYRLFKRLLLPEAEGSVTLWSDNQSEHIAGKPKYAAKTIKLDRINKLCLLTDILKKPNY